MNGQTRTVQTQVTAMSWCLYRSFWKCSSELNSVSNCASECSTSVYNTLCHILVLHSVQNCKALCRKKQEELYHFQQSFYYGHTTKGAQSKWDWWIIMRRSTMLLPNAIPVTQTCLKSPIPLSHKVHKEMDVSFSGYSIV